jgi:NitT/TauT family transport system ATP-binding protein
VALGGRCLVFSVRPGTIIKEGTIRLPRDRDILKLREDPTYQRLCGELWDLIAPRIDRQLP